MDELEDIVRSSKLGDDDMEEMESIEEELAGMGAEQDEGNSSDGIIDQTKGKGGMIDDAEYEALLE